MATTIVPGNNGLEKVKIDSPHGHVEIYRLGACITEYTTGGGTTAGVSGDTQKKRNLIFTSRTSNYQRGKAIRGGVPICWPWFGAHPSDPAASQHGFARSMEWDVLATTDNSATFGLQSSPETKKWFPHDFKLTYVVTLEAQGLSFALTTQNTCRDAFSYEEALHTYFCIGDISQTTVTGFRGLTYIDKVDNFSRKLETAERVPVTGETDRVYLDAAGPHVISSPLGTIRVYKRGSKNTVFWNPWQKKAESLADLAGGQWPTFVCVEAVNSAEHGITLKPGESHTIECRIEPA